MPRITRIPDAMWGSAWTLLIALTVARIAYGVQFQAVGAVGPLMVTDLGLAYTTLGTLVGAYSMLEDSSGTPSGLVECAALSSPNAAYWPRADDLRRPVGQDRRWEYLVDTHRPQSFP